MAQSHTRIGEYLKRIAGSDAADDKSFDPEHAVERLAPCSDPRPPRVPGASLLTPEAIARRWDLLDIPQCDRSPFLDEKTLAEAPQYSRNIENFIGTMRIPVGLAGPLRVNGLHAHGDYYVPLATTEGALVASYHRGALAVTDSGGCAALLLGESLGRAPGFIFDRLEQAGRFAAWVAGQFQALQEAAAATTSHGRLCDVQVTVEGNHVYLGLEFHTADAAGQNMVTLAADAVCKWVLAHAPVTPKRHFVEANLSGDKKASARSFLAVRGRKVSCEAVLPAEVVRDRLRTSAVAMVDYWRMSALGGVMSGTIGVHGHYANGLAALYIATGQDAACVSESAVGITRFEETPDGGLYAAVTLPNLIVGTVGGGVNLPGAALALRILGIPRDGGANALAEVACALALAGELSIIAALSAGHFAGAHRKRARGSLSE